MKRLVWLRRLAMPLLLLTIVGSSGAESGLARGPAAPGAVNLTPSNTPIVGGFAPGGGAINGSGPSADPTLTLGNLLPGSVSQPWSAYSAAGQVRAASFDSSTATWEPRGSALNAQLSNTAGKPSMDFAGAGRTTPWVAFVETAGGLGALGPRHLFFRPEPAARAARRPADDSLKRPDAICRPAGRRDGGKELSGLPASRWPGLGAQLSALHSHHLGHAL